MSDLQLYSLAAAMLATPFVSLFLHLAFIIAPPVSRRKP